MSRPQPDADTIARLEALARELAALEPEIEHWLAATAEAEPERERARRAALQLRLQASRISAVLSPVAPEFAPTPWHGQERRGPQRATNVARLPERPAGRDESGDRPGAYDWEPF